MSNFKELVRLGKDATTRYTQNGKAVTGFSAAFDNGWGDRKQTVWLDCSAWGERYEKLAQHLTKGAQIVVAGDIGTREHDGKTYVTLDVHDIKLVGKGEGKSEPKGSGSARREPAKEDTPFDRPSDDDIPFITNEGVW